MDAWKASAAALAASMLVGMAHAQEDEVAEGAKHYMQQCQSCHGKVTTQQTGELPIPPQAGLGLLALGSSGHSSTMIDAGNLRLAVAPPFGPHLRGIIGRPAGSIQGFVYSKAFMASLLGMEWNEAALDVWMTNPQAWVPGVYMFYKMKDPEIRRKIIVYLKANQ